MARLNSRKIKKFIRSFSVIFCFLKKNFFTLLKTSSPKSEGIRLGLGKKNFFRPAIIIILIIVIVVQSLSPEGNNVYGATYTFTQTSWTGGTDGGVVASHPSNQTGWDKYSSSTNLETWSSGLRMASTTHTTIDDGTLTTDAVASTTNGGFLNGIFTGTVATGTGSNTSISLSGTTTVLNTFSTLTAFPAAAAYGFDMIRNNAEDYIYIEAGNSNRFYRYSISGNSYTTLAVLPGVTYDGAQLLRQDGDDFIYATQGNISNGFYRYSISGNSWVSLTPVPVNVFSGAIMIRNGNEDFIYLLPGNSTAAFYRYSISGNSWTALTSAPGTITNGTYMIRNGSEDFIYVMRGGSASMFRYSISGNSWATMTAAPGAVATGCTMLRNATDDLIYVVQAGSTATGFWAYSISGNSWTSLTAIPMNVYLGRVTAVRKGSSDFIYVASESFSNRFYRYSISGNSWTQMQNVGSTSGFWGKMLLDNNEDVIYLQPGESTAFYKFTVQTTVYNSNGAFTSAPLNLSAANYSTLSWTSLNPSQSGANALSFQVSTSSDGVSYSAYTGPSGPASYYTSSPADVSSINASKYLKYKVLFNTANTAYTPTLSDVTLNYKSYATSGSLISSAYDTADGTNVLANIKWNSTMPSGTTVKLQLRSGATTSSLAAATWIGPSGTNADYFTNGVDNAATIPTSLKTGNDDRFVQYQAYFSSPDGSLSPSLASTTLTYVVNASPEIQNPSAVQNADGSVTVSYQVRDLDTNTGTITPGFITPSFKYWNGSTYVDVSSLNANATSTKAVNVDGVTWTTYTASWYPKQDFAGQNTSTTKIQITIDDREAANNTVVTTTPNFSLDTLVPSNASIVIDASVAPARLTLAATDSSTIQMKISAVSDLTGASYVNYNTTSSILAASDPVTAYVQFIDGFSNTTSILSATSPDTPTSTLVQDISNLKSSPPSYRLFIAWKTANLPTPGFGSYKVYRSSDNISWTLVGTVTDRLTNYYMDATVPASTLEYYKVTTVDANGNVSFFGNTVSGKADGVQNAGEGGGGLASAPVISNVVTSTVTPSQATITWDTDSLSNSIVNYGTVPGSFPNSVTVSSMVDRAGGVANHNVILSGLTANTTYYFSVQSTNSSNSSTTDNNGGSGYVFQTLSSPVIVNPPTVTEILNATATVSWLTNTAADSYLFYSTNTTFASAVTISDPSYSLGHTLSFGSLTPGTKYYYYVRTREVGGNTEYDKNIVGGVVNYYAFATTNDTTAPTFSSFSVTPATSSAVVSWTTDKKSDSQIDFGLTAGYGSTSTIDNTQTFRHTVIVSGLSASTTYHYRARSRDANNNLGLSSDQTFSTLAAPDTTPPVISGLATSSVGLSFATLSWNTSKNTNATVDVGTSMAYGSLFGSLYDFSSSTHSVNLTGLLGNTLYYFRVNSADSAGNSASSTGTFVTVPDLTPPTVVSSSTLVNDTAAFVNWETNELAYGYVNYGPDLLSLNSQVAVTSTSYIYHSLPLTGLTPLTSYYYQIITVDLSGNTTTLPVTVLTTLAAGTQTVTVTRIVDNTKYTDTTAPTISNLKVTNLSSFSADISWTTDKDSYSVIKYGRTANYGSMAGDDENLTQSHNVTLNNLDPATTYHFKAKSTDKYGNLGSSDDTVFTTLNIDGTTAKPLSETPSSTDDKVKSEKQFVLDKIINAPVNLLAAVLDAVINNPLLKNLPEDKLKSLGKLVSQIGDAPVIVGLRPQVEVHGNTAKVSWSTDKKTSGAVAFAKETEYLVGTDKPYTTTIVDENGGLSTAHVVELNSLASASRYHFQVLSKGEIGPEARSKDYTFDTEAVLPQISGLMITDVKATEAVVSWKTNVPTASDLEYTNIKNNKILTSGDPTLLVNHNFNLQNLEPGTKYSLVVKAKNESGQEVSSTPLLFETVLDKEAPIAINILANSTIYPGSTSKVQTIISWDTSEPAESQLFYQEGVVDTDNIKTMPLETSFTNKHFIVLTSFKSGSVYKYWVESTDQSGNKGTSKKFTTLTPTEKQTIIDIITNNFQSVFGWTKNVGL